MKSILYTSQVSNLSGYDKYRVSAMNRRNSTYVKLAKEIYSIYEDDLTLGG